MGMKTKDRRLHRLAALLLAGMWATWAPPVSAAENPYAVEDFRHVAKFDAHIHANTADAAFLELARAENFQLLTINVDYPDFPPIDDQARFGRDLARQEPARFHHAATFSMQGWGAAGWAAGVEKRLRDAVAQGAVAVKIWKNVGMEARDGQGHLVMIDDPGFDPVVAAIRSLGVVLIGHQGEPHNCWQPLDKMTTANDRAYFEAHPQYHMYLHPNQPSYEDQMAARDGFLDRNPKLDFVGAHLASLEWSIDHLAAFLDRYPDAHVDMAARMTQIQYQSLREPEKVRAFFIKYQDRILYGSDLTLNPGTDPAAFKKEALDFWKSDWIYMATAENQRIQDLDADVPGLALPRPVINKIWNDNARRVFLRR